MESTQSYVATLTTGPDFDPLLLLLALPGDVYPNPGPPKYLCSVCFKNVKVPATCVQDVRIRYIQDVLVFTTLRIVVEIMDGFVPPIGRHHSHTHLPNLLFPPTMSDKTFNILQWNANGINKKQMELSIFLETHNVKVITSSEWQIHTTMRSDHVCCVYPLPRPMFVGVVQSSRFWSTSQHISPSGQELHHSSGVFPKIQG